MTGDEKPLTKRQRIGLAIAFIAMFYFIITGDSLPPDQSICDPHEQHC